jgi:type IV pilus modification protein PilV
MAITIQRKRSVTGQRGMSLVELMIALTVLAVGMVGILAIILSSMVSNNRNKLDTAGTFIAQGVMEQILVQPPSASPSLSLTDCAGNTFTVNTAGSASPGTGATLYTSTTAPAASLVDSINFTQNRSGSGGVPAGYQMSFATCNANGVEATYDVRWNIINLTSTPTITKLVTVSARQLGSTGNIKIFAPPVTLRSIAGQP